jgi:hypothetical protein
LLLFVLLKEWIVTNRIGDWRSRGSWRDHRNRNRRSGGRSRGYSSLGHGHSSGHRRWSSMSNRDSCHRRRGSHRDRGSRDFFRLFLE